MILVGCDLHTRKQQVAMLDTDTGEVVEQELAHAGDAVEHFYAALPPPVTVGIESTGYSLWFHTLLQRLGHTLLVGVKHVVSYIGLAPTVNASADKYRLGHISKQGSAVLRWVLGQAAPLAARADAELKRSYFAVLRRRGRPKAKVALARRLLVRLYVMLRDQIDYDEFCSRGRARRRAAASSPV